MSSRKIENPEQLREELVRLLRNFEETLKNENLRFKILKLAEAFGKLRRLGVAVVLLEEADSNSASDRILLYLRRYVGSIVSGDELMVVSGIQDYPRRVRELRVQFGWNILSGAAIKQMIHEGDLIVTEQTKVLPDHYLLLHDEQDKGSAYRWNRANAIRKEKTGGGKQKILKFLKENVGVPITGEELRYVAGDSSEWARRVRELRTEDGWKIKTRHTGRPDLQQGVYILEDDLQAERHDRNIPDHMQIGVLERDHYRCLKCDWSRDKLHPDDRRQRLELHHVKYHSKKGENTLENLATLCNVCHDLIHRLDKENIWSAEQFYSWVNPTP
ncbi:MAG: HNH endonuclease [Saprospiraceae bacterium]|nr:HNH endonuclease [Saprospiraceae bacterium]